MNRIVRGFPHWRCCSSGTQDHYRRQAITLNSSTDAVRSAHRILRELGRTARGRRNVRNPFPKRSNYVGRGPTHFME